MFGRRAPLAEPRALLAAAADGRGGTVLIVGEPGIGKTTLVEAFAAEMADGGAARVVWGWCAPEAPAYWPGRNALDGLASDHPLRGEPVAGGSGARYTLFRSVRDLLAASGSGRPLVVVPRWALAASVPTVRRSPSAGRSKADPPRLRTWPISPGDARPELAPVPMKRGDPPPTSTGRQPS
jgi:hypothetical protein